MHVPRVREKRERHYGLYGGRVITDGGGEQRGNVSSSAEAPEDRKQDGREGYDREASTEDGWTR